MAATYRRVTKTPADGGRHSGRQLQYIRVEPLLHIPPDTAVEGIAVVLGDGVLAVDLIVAHLIEQKVLTGRRSVGGRTPSGAELTEVEPGGQALGEGVGEDPREVHGRIEHAVAVVGQDRKPVVTAGDVEEELVSPAYVGREIERVDRAPRQHGIEWWPQ